MAVWDAGLIQRLQGLDARRRQIIRPGADVAAMRSVAIAKGAELISNPFVPDTAPVLLWDLSHRCVSPWLLDILGEGHRRLVTAEETWVQMSKVSILGMCRKCVPCMRFKSWLWSTRGAIEVDASVRTWFATMTYDPAVYYIRQLQAEQRYGSGWSALSGDERSSLVLAECGHDLRLFMVQMRALVARGRAAAMGVAKRNARGATGLRQMAVVELHQSGVPHFHALIHERDELMPVRKRTLEAAWPHGHSQFRLVENGENAARYVSKYLAKDAVARVRASPRYGQDDALPAAIEPMLKF